MTVTVDTKTLNLEGGGIEENIEPVGTFIDKWIDGEYKKDAKILGTVRSWALRCYESNVAWSDSAAKHLQGVAKAGNSVTFSVDEGNMHSVSSTKVYVLGVDIRYPKGAKASQFTRFFTVKLQEAPA